MTSVVILYVDSKMYHVSEKMTRQDAISTAKDLSSNGSHVEAVDFLGEDNEELLWTSRLSR